MQADERRLKQIIINILSNAIKFTMNGGITISCNVLSGNVFINISDTGIGIKPEDINKLFTEFCTIKEHMTYNPNGTGLGLYLSKNLANLMNGDITVSSVYGKGTEFTIKLPLEKKQFIPLITIDETCPIKQREIKKVPLNNPYKNETHFHMSKNLDPPIEDLSITDNLKGDGLILVVDDSPTNVFVMCEMIEKLSFKTEKAYNGKQAIDMVKSNSLNKRFYSMIFMDINMPIMSGIEVNLNLR